jgi:butyrate kinase
VRRLLLINPGSTSTKVALYEDQHEVEAASIEHPSSELAAFPCIAAQAGFRLACIEIFLAGRGAGLAAVVGRGGLLKPISGGTYRVNAAMLADLAAARLGEHASNLGAILAHGLAEAAGCAAYIVDPVVVDELDEVARISGIPEITRRSIFHALNQKSVARETAERLGRPYAACRFIVAHLGGGISVGAHTGGRVVDVNNALDGDGPFSPERSGGLPAGQLAELCFSGRLSLAAVKKRITGQGGLVAYRGSNRFAELAAAARAGDAQAELLCAALAYQVAQEIAKHGATLEGRVDRIILTGGMAHDADLVERIRRRVGFLAPVEVVPGEREMLSLARGYLAVADGREPALEYGA